MDDNQLQEKIQQLRLRGYATLSDEIPIEKIKALRDIVHDHFVNQETNSLEEGTPFLNRGHDVIYNVQKLGIEILGLLLGNSSLENILIACLNDPYYRQIPHDKPNYILRSYVARSSGAAEMPLHIDSFIPSSGKEIAVMQVSIVLERQSPNNGCTLVVPKSHLSDSYASADNLKDAIALESNAGDIVIWDSRLWHGAHANKSGNTRWALIGTFSRWWIKQNYQITKTLDQSIYEQLDDSQKAVMGYVSLPPVNENQRIDVKAGYEALKPLVSDYFD